MGDFSTLGETELHGVSDSQAIRAEAASPESTDAICRDIVVAIIRSGVRLVGVQNTDPEEVGGVYGRLFNAVRHTIGEPPRAREHSSQLLGS